jgi:hypothetical protein
MYVLCHKNEGNHHGKVQGQSPSLPLLLPWEFQQRENSTNPDVIFPMQISCPTYTA